jgi:23S rRNA pseudouridine2605 synthase
MSKKKIAKGFSPYQKKKESQSPTKKSTSPVNIAKIGAGKVRQEKVKHAAGGSGDMVRLNKFIANSGVCSRREADLLIAGGSVTVNGKIVTELGTKVNLTDVVLYNGEKLKAEKKVYVLLNKPKDFITTSTDPQGRKTVMDLIKNACSQRLHAVGRLDRNTTGLLLLTNDGELTKKLTHPKHGVRKLYHVVLDKPLTKNDMEKLRLGVELDGEKIVPDELAYTGRDENRTNIGIEIHSGQNRVVRRLFETLDYKVLKLDRVTFAGLTKKDLPRGQWRFLTEKEVSFLMMIK